MGRVSYCCLVNDTSMLTLFVKGAILLIFAVMFCGIFVANVIIFAKDFFVASNNSSNVFSAAVANFYSVSVDDFMQLILLGEM